MHPYRVAILGATGLVGQRLVQRLVGHPWFRIHVLAASERSAGRAYAEAVRWALPGDPPEAVAGRVVRGCVVKDPGEFADCDLAFSALDAATAREVEPRLAAAGLAVVSNSSAHRMLPDVPLVVPEVNASHLTLLERAGREGAGGFIVANPNCSVIGLALVVAPLHATFGVRRVVVATLQAVSGAGADGPSAHALLDNVLPWIEGEEEKIEQELRKLLGTPEGDGIRPAEVQVSAACHRVAALDGHVEAVSLELGRPATGDEIARCLAGFRGEVAELGLPSAPRLPVVVRAEPDRPQPRLDRDTGGGMSVVVGRLRECPVLGWKLVLLSHNMVRGAAGGTVLLAELLAARGLLPRRAAR